MFMFLALLLTQPDPRFEGLRNRLVEFCRSDSACIERQQEGVRHFMGIWVVRNAPEDQVERCMADATEDKLTDWVKAANCLRSATEGRQGLLSAGIRY